MNWLDKTLDRMLFTHVRPGDEPVERHRQVGVDQSHGSGLLSTRDYSVPSSREACRRAPIGLAGGLTL